VLFIPRSTPAFPAAADAHGPFSLLNRAFAHPLPNIPDGAPFADFVAAAEGGEDDQGKADEPVVAAAAPAGETAEEGVGGGAAGEVETETKDEQLVSTKGAGRIVVASQPRGQSCAVVGGIMATRLHRLGARGLCVDGRVRDLGCLSALGLPVRPHPRFYISLHIWVKQEERKREVERG
jgi:hypothetical protein